MLSNRRYCYPLTVTDFVSRYLLVCEALSSTQEKFAFTVFERAFKDFGLPGAIRTDNGVPFAYPTALHRLSKLAVWWLRLGIRLERIEPGKPQQNGRHERMHLTLKREATKPAAANVLQQQARFDAFVERFNQERPHQALGLKVPADLYVRSPRVYRGLTYPFHDATYIVTHCGRICFKGRKVNLSHVFAGQNVGVTQVREHIWLVTFMLYDFTASVKSASGGPMSARPCSRDVPKMGTTSSSSVYVPVIDSGCRSTSPNWLRAIPVHRA
jgi:putative transposase